MSETDLKEKLKASIELEDQSAPLFSPLKPDVEYVDATAFQQDVVRRLKEQEELLFKLMTALSSTQNGLLAAQKSLIRAHQELAVLQATKPKSSLVLPDRMN